MKSSLSIILIVVSVLLAAALAFVKHGDSVQLENTTGSLADFSNRLDTAYSQITADAGNLLALSNSLADSTAAALALSNSLMQAQSGLAQQSGQITSLNSRLAEAAAARLALDENIADLTNQLAALKLQMVATRSGLDATNAALVQLRQDYFTLGERLKADVAARLVWERKFRSPAALREQIDFLKNSPEEIYTAERIYAGLNIEVQSNGTVRVLAPE